MNKRASTSSSYAIESLDLWHAKIGHVSVDSIKRLKHLNLIPKLYNMNLSKCEACVEAKFHKKPFKSIERHTELLELIHNELGDFKNHITRCGKKVLYYLC